jgi:cell division protein FtsI (penicillin-binding protein 3)
MSSPTDGLASRLRGAVKGFGGGRRAIFPSRIKLAIAAFALVYVAICGRLVMLAVAPDDEASARLGAEASLAVTRPDIIDRNGEMLATDIKVVSIFAEPRKLIDVDEAVELLSATLPDLDEKELRQKLSTQRGFEWIKREATPLEQAAVHRLGIPGIGFLPEKRRVYPAGPIVSHMLGFVNVDNEGIAGIEKYLDTKGLVDRSGKSGGALPPVRMALDLEVQHAVRDELAKAQAKFKAIAATGIVADVETGELIAGVSLPDFDPNNPAEANDPLRINRVNVGVYEMGSTFKALTLAMGLDSGRITLNSSFDARAPLHYGRFRIDDFHPTRRVLTVPEVFIHSSNIGTAKIALAMGVEHHKWFLKKLGQLDRLRTELAESSAPIVPRRWGELNTVTIAFGHGLSVAPLQTVMATAALVNGGVMIPPTVLARTADEAEALGTRVIKPETSLMMRYLMRLNAENPAGSAKKANIPGYRVGGKTGTAEKVVNGRYSSDKVMCAFTAVFPSDAPRYLVLVMLDEPKGLPETYGFRTAGWNVAPTAGAIVERVAPLLGVQPMFNTPPAADIVASLGVRLGIPR